MALPDPKPGLVIRYDYLWSREAAVGRQQGKDRPTCIVAAADNATKPRHVVLLPIAYAPPFGDTVGIEIPIKIKQAIGLDEAPSWIIVSEYNVDEWPNAGLTPIPSKSGAFSYGFIPPGSFSQTKAKFLLLERQGKAILSVGRAADRASVETAAVFQKSTRKLNKPDRTRCLARAKKV